MYTIRVIKLNFTFAFEAKYAAFVDRLRIYHVDQAVPELLEMCLSLSPEFWY